MNPSSEGDRTKKKSFPGAHKMWASPGPRSERRPDLQTISLEGRRAKRGENLSSSLQTQGSQKAKGEVRSDFAETV